MTSPAHHECACSGGDAWKLPEQEPTNLIALWPDKEAPTRVEVVGALSNWFGRPVQEIDRLSEEDPDIQWCVAIKLPTLTAPVVVWCERAQPIMPDELGNLAEQVYHWVVGAETILDAEDPLTEFVGLVRALASALSETPAILDVNTTRWHTRRELDDVFGSDTVEPPADVLWVVQAIHADDGAGGGPVWLHTHGLWRCGVPELEMLQVPLQYAEPAAELLADVAALVLECPPPAPGESLEIGTELQVTFQPWQVLVPTLPEGAPGGLADRVDDEENAHAGARAVMCAAPANADDWAWPEAVVTRLTRDEAGVYMTRRATERQSHLARAAFCELAMAFATVANATPDDAEEPPARFGIKAGFAEDAEGRTGREHLWFEAKQFDGDRVEGVLVNSPFAVKHLSRGDRVWIERDRVSDWLVAMPNGSYGPNDIAALWRAVDEVKQQVTNP